MVLQYDNLYKVFKNWNSCTDSYIGVMFGSIYELIPVCYYISFDSSGKLIYDLYSNKSLYFHDDIDEEEDDINDNKYVINDRLLLEAFRNNPEQFEVVNYSPVEYIILGTQFPFIMLVTINDASKKSFSQFYSFYTSNTTNADDIFNLIKPYFINDIRENDIEFGIAAVDNSGSLYTSWYDFNKIDIDIDKNYNDDIPYERLCKIINTKNKSALMLFYGDPGTGKSSLIKHLITKYPQKEFIFIDGSLLANVQQDRLMAYFLENENTIFIFEDCEKILLNRDHNYNPTMSILLNLTDGIISDVLNLKIICTFNTSLNNIDKALLRKGRLTLKYEFNKLKKEKVKKILNDDTINEDMTLADIYNYNEENDFSKKNTHKIGF